MSETIRAFYIKSILLALVVAVVPIIAGASDNEYGKPSELAGVTRIFVDTDGNLELRNNIVGEILDDIEEPYSLTVVDRIEQAEVVLVVSSITTRRGNPYTEITAMRIPDEESEPLRVLWQWGDENTSRFGRRPSSRAADRFVAEWKKFNKEKPISKPITKDLVGVTSVCLIVGDPKREGWKEGMRQVTTAVQGMFDLELGPGVLTVVPCGKEDVILTFYENSGGVHKMLDPRCDSPSCMVHLFNLDGVANVFIASFIQRFQADNPR